jgi:tRNA dimethylallyltransferase
MTPRKEYHNEAPTRDRGDHTQRLIVVAGPTASGKSDLAIALARRLDGEIISADSRQVYRGMDIGTGKVSRNKRKKKSEKRAAGSVTTRFSSLASRYLSGRVPHHLLDVASPKRRYTVARWRKAAEKAIADIASRGKIPIVCGGTGFYIDALVYGLSLPEVPPDVTLRAGLERRTTEELFTRLKILDPRRAADIDRHNRRRLIRALEIVLKTGKPVPSTGTIYGTGSYDVLYFGIDVPMNRLKERIEKRLDTRLRAGMVAEVRNLRAQGVHWKRLEEFGLEYRWIARFLQKKISRTEMRDGLLRDIIAYAKRQMTWFKRNPGLIWVQNKNKALRLAERFLES